VSGIIVSALLNVLKVVLYGPLLGILYFGYDEIVLVFLFRLSFVACHQSPALSSKAIHEPVPMVAYEILTI
jgi:hypothetical protein